MDTNSTWSVLQNVLSIQKNGPTVAVPAKGCKRAVVALDEIGNAFPQHSLVSAVREAIYSVDESLYKTVRKYHSYN